MLITIIKVTAVLLAVFVAWWRGVVLGNRNGLACGYGKGFVSGREAGRKEVLDDVNRRLNAVVKNNPPIPSPTKFVQ